MSGNREWIVETLAHRETGRVPYNFLFAPPALELAKKHYGDPIDKALDLPIRMMGCKSIKPLYAPPAKHGSMIVDEFGVEWSTSDIDRGSPLGPALREPDLSHYTFPDPATEYRFDGLFDWCAAQETHFRFMWVGDLWERATFMRGMEDVCLDLSLHPKFVEQLLDGLANHILGTMKILFERYDFEGVAVSDDYGTQHGLLMSPAQWRHFVKPRLKKIYALAKKNKRTVFHHSCGNVVEIIPDLIDIGLDVLHPIQPEAMDVPALKREFGKSLTFSGGVRTQDLLPFGTPDDVRKEVRRLKKTMGKGGGYILEPGITLQADVPLANIVALIDEARA